MLRFLSDWAAEVTRIDFFERTAQVISVAQNRHGTG